MLTPFTDDKKINQVLWLFLISYGVLILVIAVDTFLSITQPNKFWPALLLQIVPLIMLLPGIVLKRYRSYSWVCFLMLIYFVSYVVQVYASSSKWIDWLGLLTTIILFVSAMYASRFLQRYFLKQT